MNKPARYTTIKYKDLVLQVVKKHLSTKHSKQEVKDLLSGWHSAENTESRNNTIEQSINEIEDIITLSLNFYRGTITEAEFIGQLKERFNEQ